MWTSLNTHTYTNTHKRTKTSKFDADLIQGSLVKACKGYHIRRAQILVPKTGKDIEVLQSANTFEKTPFLNIFEILAQAAFAEKDQDDDQNQLIPCLIRQHTKLRIYSIINCYILNKVPLIVVRIILIFL